MNVRTLLIVSAAAAPLAGCDSKPGREVYAVGGYVGTGSIFGSTTCTHVTTPATGVADLTEEKTMGELIGEGVVVATCPKVTFTYDVKKPTGAIITGESTIQVGKPRELYRAVPVAGKRELQSSGEFKATWKVGDDCAASVTAEEDQGSQDFGGRSYTIWLEAKAKGTCTLTGEVLGLKATRTITIK